MKTEIYSWMKNLAVFYILLTMVLHLVPNKTYERYVRLFMGFLLIFILGMPIFTIFGKGEEMIEDFQFHYEEESVHRQQKELENLQKIYLEKGYEWEMQQKIRDELKERGIYPEEVKVDIEGEEAEAVVYMKALPDETGKGRVKDGMEACGFREGTYQIKVYKDRAAAMDGYASSGNPVGCGGSAGIP